AGGPSAEPGEGDAARDLAKLQGKWRLVEEDRDGTVTKIRDGDGHVITIEKEFELWHDAEGTLALQHSLKLHPSRSPKEMDATTVINPPLPKRQKHHPVHLQGGG